MPSLILHAAIGDRTLGTIEYDPNRRRWDIQLHGKFYSFRDAEDAAVALQMLADEQEAPRG